MCARKFVSCEVPVPSSFGIAKTTADLGPSSVAGPRIGNVPYPHFPSVEPDAVA